MFKNKIPAICLTALFALSLTSCGSDLSSDLTGTYSVNDVNVLSNNIEIGERVRVEVFFETKTELGGDPDGVDVVVRIPPELSYVANTSELYDNSTDNSDTYTPNNVVTCPTGETYLIYNFSDSELSSHELDTFGKFGLKFLAQGQIATKQTLVGATAGSNQSFNCGEFFPAEQNEAVEVLASTIR